MTIGPAGIGGRSPTLTRVAARDVGRSFGSVVALRRVSVEVARGELLVVAGTNGSGKSTLLSVLGGRLRPTSGTVDYEGLADTARALRSALGWVSHESLCYPDLSGFENLAFAARAHDVDVDEALRAMTDRFDLREFGARPVRSYSRGQRQRVALARALVHQPALLLLDEPTTGLDARSTERLVRVVGEELARGVAAVVVSHDLESFARLESKRLTLERGRVTAPSFG